MLRRDFFSSLLCFSLYPINKKSDAKLKIGDIVKSSLGSGSIGVITNITTYKNIGPCPLWDRMFPNWKSKRLIVITFKEPSLVVTEKEWREGLNRTLPYTPSYSLSVRCPEDSVTKVNL